LKTIFENEHFIIVDKPSGWLSVDSRDPRDERPCAGRIIEKDMAAKGTEKARIWPCHRLDAEVSGILIFAKSSEAHRAANGWFEKHLVQKTYDAFSEPLANAADHDELRAQLEKTQLWHSNIARGKRRSYEADFGKEAITRVKLLGEFDYPNATSKCLHWQMEPLTGRPHQLRFELFKHKSPIIGDELYGARIKYPNEGIALRAFHVKFLDKHRTMWGLPEEFHIDGLAKI
jgi:tRNA pseudouridine32 synthase / 23S rRNA pseudouridine746 synthase